MRVILLEDVEGLGTKGDLVEVAPGYGRNYLVPRGLAEVATKGNIKSLEQRRQALLRRAERERAEAQQLAERLAAQAVKLSARAGETGRLFGSVTSSDIADAVQAQLGIELDRRRIDLEEPIKAAGSYQVPVRLASGVTGVIQVEVSVEGAEAGGEAEAGSDDAPEARADGGE